MNAIELLSPARNSETAFAAIKCGADAIYIGASSFGARQQASNSIEQIKTVVDFAHPFYAKVYVTLNTILFDNELSIAEKIIQQLYDIGIDGLIIQDAGLLELDLPPIPLIASTQMNNDTPEKVRFLEQVGFSRVILARELTIEQIRQIRKATSIELECFIHGSLCVGASGQCYMSYALGGRSGNRGQCAQPCRKLYSLKDPNGKTLLQNRHLLSLKDLNLSEHIEQLIDAGITAFKIEGRLKEIPYVANTVAFYRQKLDAVLQKKNLQRSSSGTIQLNFKPDPAKTFNRGFTDYALNIKDDHIGSIDTPKSIGEFVGTITKIEKSSFATASNVPLHAADGLCFFDQNGNLTGTLVNKVEGQKVWPQKTDEIKLNLKIYRNYDHQFSKLLEKNPAERKIPVSILFEETENGFSLTGADADGNKAVIKIDVKKQPALKKQEALQTITTQLKKLGGTIFECDDISFQLSEPYFFPVSTLNAARRDLVRQLLEIREANRPRKIGHILKNSFPYPPVVSPPTADLRQVEPEKRLTYLGNCLNEKARDFYRRHGVETIEPAAESGLDMAGKLVMTTRYCLRKELGLCKEKGQGTAVEPLILVDEDGRQFRIVFHCGRCGMDIFLI